MYDLYPLINEKDKTIITEEDSRKLERKKEQVEIIKKDKEDKEDIGEFNFDI